MACDTSHFINLLQSREFMPLSFLFFFVQSANVFRPPEFDVSKYLEERAQPVEQTADGSDEDSLPSNPNRRPVDSEESEDESEED